MGFWGVRACRAERAYRVYGLGLRFLRLIGFRAYKVFGGLGFRVYRVLGFRVLGLNYRV